MRSRLIPLLLLIPAAACGSASGVARDVPAHGHARDRLAHRGQYAGPGRCSRRAGSVAGECSEVDNVRN